MFAIQSRSIHGKKVTVELSNRATNRKEARFFEAGNRSSYIKNTGEAVIEKWQTACRLILGWQGG